MELRVLCRFFFRVTSNGKQNGLKTAKQDYIIELFSVPKTTKNSCDIRNDSKVEPIVQYQGGNIFVKKFCMWVDL